MLAIGDRVRVISTGQIYPYVEYLFKQWKFKNIEENGGLTTLNKEGIIMFIDIENSIRYGVFMDDGQQIVINSKGLDIISSSFYEIF